MLGLNPTRFFALPPTPHGRAIAYLLSSSVVLTIVYFGLAAHDLGTWQYYVLSSMSLAHFLYYPILVIVLRRSRDDTLGAKHVPWCFTRGTNILWMGLLNAGWVAGVALGFWRNNPWDIDTSWGQVLASTIIGLVEALVLLAMLVVIVLARRARLNAHPWAGFTNLDELTGSNAAPHERPELPSRSKIDPGILLALPPTRHGRTLAYLLFASILVAIVQLGFISTENYGWPAFSMIWGLSPPTLVYFAILTAALRRDQAHSEVRYVSWAFARGTNILWLNLLAALWLSAGSMGASEVAWWWREYPVRVLVSSMFGLLESLLLWMMAAVALAARRKKLRAHRERSLTGQCGPFSKAMKNAEVHVGFVPATAGSV